jgi:phosphoglycerate kinase
MKAKGESVGKSLVEDDKLDMARELMARAGEKLMLPVDHAVAPEKKGGGEPVHTDTIPGDQMGLDIGPETVDTYTSIVNAAKTIIWNGPMGVFEMPPFDRGTVDLAKAVAASGAISVVGGGDSEKAIKTAGVADRITHISTGGGASLEFLSGIELPGVAALTDKVGG